MMGLVAASIMLAAAAAVCIANVHDGDIIRLCDGERIRIVNIDAPEMPGSPKCQRGRNGWCDYRLASQTPRRSSSRVTPACVSYGRVLVLQDRLTSSTWVVDQATP